VGPAPRRAGRDRLPLTRYTARVRVGLISDTHGTLRPEAVAALAGSDVLVHAGDVGGPAVLEGLRATAPVHAIRGNVDEPDYLRTEKRPRRGLDPDWAAALPTRLQLQLGGLRWFVVHRLEDWDRATDPADVVVVGHSHQPRVLREGDALIVNPGSAGPRRFSLPVSVARVDVFEGAARAELLTLDVGAKKR